MGAVCSSCCGGTAAISAPTQAVLTDSGVGRAREGLYEPVLADSEREAVADLLQYLENVSR